MSETVNVADTVAWLRDTLAQHGPGGSQYTDRCVLCGYTRMPCDMAEVITDALAAIEQLQDEVAVLERKRRRWLEGWKQKDREVARLQPIYTAGVAWLAADARADGSFADADEDLATAIRDAQAAEERK